MNLHPPITERSDEELVSMANSTMEYYRDEVIEAAKKELIRRGITIDQQKKIIEQWEREFEEEFGQDAFEDEIEIVDTRTESYSIIAMVVIFALAPLVFTGRLYSEMRLWDLKRQNYTRKFKQRLILLSTGLLVWFCVIYLCVKNDW